MPSVGLLGKPIASLLDDPAATRGLACGLRAEGTEGHVSSVAMGSSLSGMLVRWLLGRLDRPAWRLVVA